MCSGGLSACNLCSGVAVMSEKEETPKAMEETSAGEEELEAPSTSPPIIIVKAYLVSYLYEL